MSEPSPALRRAVRGLNRRVVALSEGLRLAKTSVITGGGRCPFSSATAPERRPTVREKRAAGGHAFAAV